MEILRILRGGEQPSATGPAPAAGEPVDLAAVRRRLAESRGRHFWRSLEELADDPRFEQMLHREFPRQAAEWSGDGTSRRRFLQLSAASLAMGGLAACVKQPNEKIVPYVRQPEELVPGKPLFFATAMTLGGYARGLLVESHMGRPTKVEGNPDHPASLGGTDLFAQASILDLYDPDRAQSVTYLGRARPWGDLAGVLRDRLNAAQALGGRGLRILTGAVTSPTLAAQLEGLLAELPEARWHVWEAAGRHHTRAGARRAFGEPLAVRYDLSRARTVLTLDDDLLTQGPGAVRYARDFALARRAAWDGGGEVPRLYSVESSPTATGTVADHRLALPPSGVVALVAALATELGVPGVTAAPPAGVPEGWLAALADDLRAAGAGALVAAGESLPPAAHVLVHAIHQTLGAAGSTVLTSDPVEAHPEDQLASLAELTAAMAAGEVDTLLVLGGNPVLSAPPDLGLAEAMSEVGLRVYLGSHADETAGYCQWLVPEAHYLEGWGDARAYDGTVSIVQPLIEPLYRGAKTAHQLVAAAAGQGDADGYDLVREHWRTAGLGGDFESAWQRAVHDGLVAGSELPAKPAAVSAAAVAEAAAELVAAAPGGGDLELCLRPDPTLWDGRFANNAWLQELPKPLTKLTWDNALLVAPATAEGLGLAAGDLVEVTVGERSLTVPAWIVPGHAAGAATLHLGHGRTSAGRVAEGSGVDVYPLRSAGALWTVAAGVRKAGGNRRMACTQDHWSMEGRHLVRSASLEHYREHPEFAQHPPGVHVPGPEESMYPGHEYNGYKWGLAVDLSACTGCSACVVACQSENNIPTVGREQVLKAREMHWLRIDRYYAGDLDDPEVYHQPVMCQHCEQAPCEVVCPVAATVHSAEGLNDMVYNRCVGTRYCSNNCPYKVRRFNFLQWVDTETEVLKMVRNPDVTVRDRGVMEKCTYCVQRINHARQEAKRQRRSIETGEVATACQQACPSDAIRFGDLNNSDEEVTAWQQRPLAYGLLAELNTRPRTQYLARLRNPNPKLETSEHGDSRHA